MVGEARDDRLRPGQNGRDRAAGHGRRCSPRRAARSKPRRLPDGPGLDRGPRKARRGRRRHPPAPARLSDLRRHRLRSRPEGPDGAERQPAALCRVPVAGAAPHFPDHVRQARAGEFLDVEGPAVQSGSDDRPRLVQKATNCRSSAGRTASTSSRSTGRTAPTTWSPAATCWSMSGTTVRHLANCCASSRRTACSTSPFRTRSARTVTRDWGFPKPEKHGHWRVYGGDVVERFKSWIPSSRCSPIAGRIPSPANGRERSCCRGRPSATAGQ